MNNLITSFVLFTAFILSFWVFLREIDFQIKTLYPQEVSTKPERNESFDGSLAKYNTIESALHYCDSSYATLNLPVFDSAMYVAVVNKFVRLRFFHGYSNYSLGNNSIASMLGKITGKSIDAITNPEDLMKFTYADCRQQSLVMTELLRMKGYQFRLIHFTAKFDEHIATEIRYNGDWHFYDPDLEPDISALAVAGRPSIEELTKNKELMLAAYNHSYKRDIVTLLKGYSYKEVNETFPIKISFIHASSKFVSLTLWLFFLVSFIYYVRRYNPINHQYSIYHENPYLFAFQPTRR